MGKRSKTGSRGDLFDIAAEFQNYPFWLAIAAAGMVLLVLEVITPAVIGQTSPTGPSGINYAALFLPFVQIIGWVFSALMVVFGLIGVLSRSARRLGDAARFERQTSLESIRQLSWQEFERLLAEGYRRQGYKVRARGGPVPDGGVDLEIHRAGETLLVQAKHWKARVVHLPQLRELWGAVAAEHADGAIFVTSGSFTADAQNWVTDKNFQLVAGEQISQLIPSVRPTVARHPNPPTCRRCGRQMVQRTARRGMHAGESFWGCSGYPDCKQTEPIEVPAR